MCKKMSFVIWSFLLLACQSTPAPKVEQVEQLKIEQWKIAGRLPAPRNFQNSIGVAATYAGFIDNYLVVAGGSNFPYKEILDGGSKEFYTDIFVFSVNNNNTLELVNSGMLPQKLSGGATVSTGKEMLLIGGANAQEESSKIYSISLEGSTPIVQEYAELPFTWSLGAAVLQERNLYLFAGKNNHQVVNKTWAYNLDTKGITSLANLPGEARIQMPFVHLNDKAYIFNGLGRLTLSDNYAYDFKSNTWEKLTDAVFNSKKFTMAGGAAIPLKNNLILVLGGVNREVFNNAVTQLGSLQGAKLKEFRQDYFSQSPEEFNFSKQQMVYDIGRNTWASIGELPFYGSAGPVSLLREGNALWIISGEIKAGVRVPEIQTGIITTE